MEDVADEKVEISTAGCHTNHAEMANFCGDLANQAGSNNGSQIFNVDSSQLVKMAEVIITIFHKS
jgi:hypothetical protein